MSVVDISNNTSSHIQVGEPRRRLGGGKLDSEPLDRTNDQEGVTLHPKYPFLARPVIPPLFHTSFAPDYIVVSVHYYKYQNTHELSGWTSPNSRTTLSPAYDVDLFSDNS